MDDVGKLDRAWPVFVWRHGKHVPLKFYISYRDYKSDIPKGVEVRKKITRWRRFSMFIQFAGFAVGVLALAIFAAANLDNVKPPHG